jgi:hypothetical protein
MLATPAAALAAQTAPAPFDKALVERHDQAVER